SSLAWKTRQRHAVSSKVKSFVPHPYSQKHRKFTSDSSNWPVGKTNWRPRYVTPLIVPLLHGISTIFVRRAPCSQNWVKSISSGVESKNRFRNPTPETYLAGFSALAHASGVEDSLKMKSRFSQRLARQVRADDLRYIG